MWFQSSRVNGAACGIPKPPVFSQDVCGRISFGRTSQFIGKILLSESRVVAHASLSSGEVCGSVSNCGTCVQTPDGGHEELPVSRQEVAPSSGDIQLQVLRAASLLHKPGEK